MEEQFGAAPPSEDAGGAGKNGDGVAQYAMTIGQGKKNAQGQLISFAAPPLEEYSDDIVEGYCRAINKVVPPEHETWFSTHTWTGNYRKKENWTSSWGVGIDLDWEDPASTWVNPAKGEVDTHCPIPADVVGKIESLVGRDTAVPGSIYYRTARGLRLVFVLDQRVSNASTYQEVARGAAVDAWEFVCKHGLDGAKGAKAGLVFDSCVFDTARMYYGPRSVVGGVQRDGTAIKLSSVPYSTAALMQRAPKWDFVNPARTPAAPDETHAPKVNGTTERPALESARLPEWHERAGGADRKRASSDPVEEAKRVAQERKVADARARFNADYLARNGQWPKVGVEPCFACGSTGGFGVNTLKPEQWYCFSSEHVGRVGHLVGHQRAVTDDHPSQPPGYCGDALDKVMFEKGWTRRGLTPAEALAQLFDKDGQPYLDPRSPLEKALDDGLRPFTLEELEGDPPILEFLWDGVLPARKAAILAAGGGTGKSSMLVGLAVHRALGKPFLGWTVKQGTTLIISAEDDRDDYWRKLKAWKSVMGAEFDTRAVADRVLVQELPGVDCALVEGRGGVFSVRASVAQAVADKAKKSAPKADLIILETASRFGIDESNPAMSALNRAVEFISRETRAAVLVVTHVSKQAGRDGTSDAYAARGGSAATDNSRSGLVLTRLNDAGKAKAVLGFEPPSEDLKKLLFLDLTKVNYVPDRKYVVLERVCTPYAGGLVVKEYKSSQSAEDVGRAQRLNRGGKLAEVLHTLEKRGVTDVTANALEKHYCEVVKDVAGIAKNRIRAAVAEAVEDGILKLEPKAGQGGGQCIRPAWRPEEPVSPEREWKDEF